METKKPMQSKKQQPKLGGKTLSKVKTLVTLANQ